MNQIDYYQAKLDFEIDSAELFAALQADQRKLVVVDARSAAAYAKSQASLDNSQSGSFPLRQHGL